MELQPQVIEELAQKIVKAVKPQRIILFGSAARGAFGPAGEIDLLNHNARGYPPPQDRSEALPRNSRHTGILRYTGCHYSR